MKNQNVEFLSRTSYTAIKKAVYTTLRTIHKKTADPIIESFMFSLSHTTLSQSDHSTDRAILNPAHDLINTAVAALLDYRSYDTLNSALSLNGYITTALYTPTVINGCISPAPVRMIYRAINAFIYAQKSSKGALCRQDCGKDGAGNPIVKTYYKYSNEPLTDANISFIESDRREIQEVESKINLRAFFEAIKPKLRSIERDIVILLASGYRQTEIAQKLNRSASWVSTTKSRIIVKITDEIAEYLHYDISDENEQDEKKA